jgi:hypothetical protein
VRLEVGVQERVEDLAADDRRDRFEEERERRILDLCREVWLVNLEEERLDGGLAQKKVFFLLHIALLGGYLVVKGRAKLRGERQICLLHIAFLGRSL